MLQLVLRFASATCVAASTVALPTSGTAIAPSPPAAPTVLRGQTPESPAPSALPRQRPDQRVRVATTTVPDVVGDSLAQAQEKLKNAGLVAGELGQVESPLPARTIARQEPAAGARLRVGAPVKLWLAIALGRRDAPLEMAPIPALRMKMTAVPDVVGEVVDLARKKLGAASLAVGDVAEMASDQDAGTVVKQDPAAGARVLPKTRVKLWLAVPGPRPEMRQKPDRPQPDIGPITVPAVIGDTLDVATAKILDAGLTVGPITRMAPSQPPDTVVRQYPAADQPVDPRTAVALWVTSVLPREPGQPGVEPPPREVTFFTVPNVVGDLVAAAVSKLGDADLSLGEVVEVPSDSPPGTVVRQSPEAGRVRSKPRVNLWVAATPPVVEVPRLVGRTEGEARAAIEGARLRPGRVGSRPSPGPPGLVLDQRPVAGSVRPIGSEVDYLLSVAEPRRMIPVPEVRGFDREKARAELEGRDLVVGILREREARDRAGVVVDQLPRPGAEVSPGTGVDLWLAVPAPVPPSTPQPTPTATPSAPITPSPTPGDTEVPDVVGLDIRAATQVLRDVGLAPGQITGSRSSMASERVTAQRPLPRAIVPRGTSVDLVVAEMSVRVPDLVGFTRVAALDALRNVGLKPGRVSEKTSSDPAGTIVQQSPSSGDAVPPGSEVELVVATPSTAAPWVLGIAAFVLTAGVAGVAGFRIARRGRASVGVTPHIDIGRQTLDADAEGLVRSDVGLEGFWDAGVQTLEPADADLVRETTEGE